MKTKLWAINTKGEGGLNPTPEVVIGLDNDNNSALAIDGEELTAEKISQIGGGASGLIIVAKAVDLVAITETTEEGEQIEGFSAQISASNFPADFIAAHDRYNLIIKIYGSYVDPEYGNTAMLGYTANHFCYVIDKTSEDELDLVQFMCYDGLDKEGTIYHSTTLEISTNDTYEIYYEGKSGVDTMLPKEGSKVSIYLQKLY